MNSHETNIDENGDIKEEFCGACAAIPFALLGAGVASAGTKQKGAHKTRRKIMLWGGLAMTAISLIIVIIYLRNCKKCA